MSLFQGLTSNASATPNPFSSIGGAPAASAAPAASPFGSLSSTTAPSAAAPFPGLSAAAPSPFGGLSAIGVPAATSTASGLFGGIAPTPASAAASPFGGLSAAPTSAAASPFGGLSAAPASTTASLFGGLAPTATSAAASPFGGLTATQTPAFAGAMTSTTPATGSLFASQNASTAASALANAAGKGVLGASTATAAPVTLTPDTIAGSTKYTELPADAKSTLDQFHSFLQAQIHLSTTLTARSSDSLDKISKDTTELSKRLEALNDTLDRDSKMVQALQDKVSQELKQADSAGRTIEAYANNSNAGFLYAGNNSAGQYFQEQCQLFEEQLRQFRGTIEEIERHLASFGSRNPQVSHALTEVMRNQHAGFLAMAGRVAALHEEISDKEKAYLMFRRKYFDDDTDPFVK
ncbi:Nucleoporin p58/p45 [Lunasporangiospora selenospora]|uniref:Nucleoporin p58/p45 n=1 Tax=Lunasporangiospora selenospora TaxID=979761 RepID=A0A9P6KGB3_9FUNG|nr:Nucleoporin p58/p45 [Lunasporangiospora selenospora]